MVMKKLHLCEISSVVIAAVLLIADFRQMTTEAPDAAPLLTGRIHSDLRVLMEIDRQSRNADSGAAGLDGNNMMQQLSGLSALASVHTPVNLNPAFTASR